MWCRLHLYLTSLDLAELIAAQLATLLTGFTGSLFADQEEMVEDSKSDKSAAWEQQYLANNGKSFRTQPFSMPGMIMMMK